MACCNQRGIERGFELGFERSIERGIERGREGEAGGLAWAARHIVKYPAERIMGTKSLSRLPIRQNQNYSRIEHEPI